MGDSRHADVSAAPRPPQTRLGLTFSFLRPPVRGWINQLLMLRGLGVPPSDPDPVPAPPPSVNPTAAETLLTLAQHGAGPAPMAQSAAPSATAPFFDAQSAMTFDFDLGFFPFTGEAANEVDLSWWYGDLGAGF